MPTYIQSRAYPLATRLEWHLAGNRWAAFAIDAVIHKPRRILREWLGPTPAFASHERRVYSQNGEDGVIDHIFKRIGTTNRFAVEFGVENGSECCTRRLVFEDHWTGLLLEGGPRWMPQLRELYRETTVQVREAFVTVESILGLLGDAATPRDLDLLVVDIDGNDYWVLERILTVYRPRVIVCEYNARFAPPTEWIMPYNETHVWDGSAYEGASLQSLFSLANSHGYVLAGCESRGVNAFFVRSELWPEAGHPMTHYAPPRYGRGFGHPVRMRLRREPALSR